MLIGVIDYGLGNLHSVAGAVDKSGYEYLVSADPDALVAADKLILPGVGAFKDGMRLISERGLKSFLDEAANQRKIPILGICLGAQLLTNGSEEFGWTEGFGWIDTVVKSLRHTGSQDRVPHIGWNNVQFSSDSKLFHGLPIDSLFYFVHSFGIVQGSGFTQTATCNYGFEFVAAFERENIFGVQFHPEKSQRHGLSVMRNFLAVG